MIRRIATKDGTYHLVFDTDTGRMARWGKVKAEDPPLCPIGPEILDIEISTICHMGCRFCYKGNISDGKNMSLATFETVFRNLPKSLTQIAFGIGDVDANPDLFPIMRHCRKNGVVPNITINGDRLIDEIVGKLADTCGAVAVSHYSDAPCFSAVERLYDAGLKQINIHQLLSAETYLECFKLVDSAASDPRLVGKLKAIVFLMLKNKGPRNTLHSLTSVDQYKKLLDYAIAKNVAIGMDSCSAPVALKSLSDSAIESIEACESGLFSFYVNTDGHAFPCSFTEGTAGWENGIDLTKISDFTSEVWYSERVKIWRANLLGSSSGCTSCLKQKHCRSCPVYPKVTLCKIGGS